MTEKTCKNVRLYYSIALSLTTVVVGTLFIWQTLDICLSGGNRPFTADIVSERLTLISPAFWIWIAMIIIGFVVFEIFSVKDKVSPLKDDLYALKRMKKRLPATVGEDGLSSLSYVKREAKILLVVRLCAAALCAAGAVYSIVYLANPAHFPKIDVTGEMIEMVKRVLPCAFVSLLVLSGVAFYESRSAKRQLEHVKKLAASSGGNLSTAGNPALTGARAKLDKILNHKYFVMGLRAAVGCLAVAFIIAGAFNGNMHAVFIKAINICTECIGLG